MSFESFVSGLAAGVSQAVFMHPVDHALYLSSNHRRKFLHSANFRHPLKGINQSFVQRVLSGGLYFTLQKNIKVDDRFNGLICGFLNGIILSPMSYIKSQGWSKQDERTNNFYKTARELYTQTNSIKPYFRGIQCTVIRDMTFSVVYELNRKEGSTFDNLKAAIYGTLCSALPNYARNQVFNSNVNVPAPSMIQCYKKLYVEIKECPDIKSKFQILNRRVLFIWGVLRVVTGITLSQYVFDTVFMKMQKN